MKMNHVKRINFFAVENLSNVRKICYFNQFKALCIHILLTVGACFSEANADTESTSM